jgi:hypothetical protein
MTYGEPPRFTATAKLARTSASIQASHVVNVVEQ